MQAPETGAPAFGTEDRTFDHFRPPLPADEEGRVAAHETRSRSWTFVSHLRTRVGVRIRRPSDQIRPAIQGHLTDGRDRPAPVALRIDADAPCALACSSRRIHGVSWLQADIMRPQSFQMVRILSLRSASRQIGPTFDRFAQGESARCQFTRSSSPGFDKFVPGRQTRVIFSLVLNSVRQNACRKQVCSDMSSISCATSSGSDVSR